MKYKRITRAQFLKVSGLSQHELDKLRAAKVIQQAWLEGTDRQAKYFEAQAIAIREGQRVPQIKWPLQKSASARTARKD